MAHFEKKNIFVNICPVLLLWTKRLFTTNTNFPLDLPLFKLVEKYKLSKYFWASFWDNHFFDQKEKFSVNFPEKSFKTTGKHNLAVCGSFWEEKQVLLIFVPFSQIFLMVYPYSNLLRKTNFLSISEILSEIVTFWLKREVFSELSRKYFKTTEKHNLAVCGSFWAQKQIMLIFVPFYCFEQKGLFTTNPNIPLDLPLFKLVEKNKLSKYSELLSEIVTFLTKKRSFQWISSKCFKTTGKHNLAVYGSFWETVFVNLVFVQFYGFDQKKLFKQIQIFLRIWPFSNLLIKTNFWVFMCSFLR